MKQKGRRGREADLKSSGRSPWILMLSSSGPIVGSMVSMLSANDRGAPEGSCHDRNDGDGGNSKTNAKAQRASKALLPIGPPWPPAPLPSTSLASNDALWGRRLSRRPMHSATWATNIELLVHYLRETIMIMGITIIITMMGTPVFMHILHMSTRRRHLVTEVAGGGS